MSSWRKASKTNQKTHRERHQPEARQQLGLLEKKKDYKLRAKNVHEKEQTLKLLHKKALNKNPDEFYHHMIKSKIVDDEHFEGNEPDVDSKDQIKLMQSQDIKYIMMKRTVEAKKIKRLQAEHHLIDAANSMKNRHTFFVDDQDDIKAFDVAKRLGTHPNLLGRKINRPLLSDLEKLNIPDLDDEKLRTISRERRNAYKELKKRIEREKELSVIQQKMELKRILQQKRVLKPKRLKPATKDTAPVYQFKYERKR